MGRRGIEDAGRAAALAAALSGCAHVEEPRIFEPPLSVPAQEQVSAVSKPGPDDRIIEPKQVKTTTSAAEAIPVVEAMPELPAGAFGWDADGLPYGFGWQNKYEYTKAMNGEPKDLSQPFPGRNRAGEVTHTIRLRMETFAAYNGLAAEFEFAMRERSDLQGIGGLFLTEGFRTRPDQEKMRRQFGAGAAKPGYSEHEIGTAIDIFRANELEVYKWLTEFDGDGHTLPPCIRYGFVPTTRKEPWHFRYVGIAEAERFWRQYRSAVFKQQTRRLVRRDQPGFYAPDKKSSRHGIKK